MNTFAVSSLLSFLANIAIAIFCFLKGEGRRDSKTLGFFCIVIVAWSFGALNFSTTLLKKEAFFWWQVAYIGAIFSSPLYYHFIYSYLNLKSKFSRFILRLTYFLSFFFLFLNFFYAKIFIGDIRLVFNQFYWVDWVQSKNSLWLFYHIAFNWVLLTYSFGLLIKAYFSSVGIVRNQMKYFIIGSVLGWVAAHGDHLLVFRINLYPYANFLMVIYPAIWAYAIIKYRLMDINIVITRTAIFVLVYSLILGLPLLMIYYLQNELVSWFGLSWWIVPFLCSTALATLGPFLYIYIDKRMEDKLLKEQKAYQSILRNASSGMIRIKDLNQLLNLVVRVVTKTVKIKHASIYLFDREENHFVLYATRYGNHIVKDSKVMNVDTFLVKQLVLKKKPIVTEEMAMRFRDESQNQYLFKLVEQLTNLDAALVVPSFVEDRLIGILVLGEKISGKPYSDDDLSVFSVLANQAALAIENAQFYNEVKMTHQQLFQAEKMATIGTMADGLSHQINNRFHALSLISGDALDLLKTFNHDGCSDDVKQILADLKNSMERVEANVLQGGEVVKGLLKYSRPGDGGFDLIDFRDVLKGAIDMVQYKIKLKEIDLIQSFPDDLTKFSGNMTQLQEVFFNLIDNAYDAIKERHLTLKEEGYRGKIEVSASNVNGSIEIILADNGMGVKDLDRKKLFTPFFTTKATAKKGTGLGLYVIEKIVSSHNGNISIDSVYKSGTRFTITLPVKSVS